MVHMNDRTNRLRICNLLFHFKRRQTTAQGRQFALQFANTIRRCSTDWLIITILLQRLLACQTDDIFNHTQTLVNAIFERPKEFMHHQIRRHFDYHLH